MHDDNAPKPCSRILPPVWFLITIVAMIALHLAVPLRTIVPGPWKLLGMVPILAGPTIVVIAVRQFKRRQTTIKPYQSSAALVTDGMFRWSRNPMYLGMTSVLVGLAVALGSVTPWSLAVAFPLWLQHCFIRAEESSLASRFSTEFEAYRSRTRRWM